MSARPLLAASTGLALAAFMLMPDPGRALSDAEAWAIAGGQLVITAQTVTLECCGVSPDCKKYKSPKACLESDCTGTWIVPESTVVLTCIEEDLEDGEDSPPGDDCSKVTEDGNGDPIEKNTCATLFGCLVDEATGRCQKAGTPLDHFPCKNGSKFCRSLTNG